MILKVVTQMESNFKTIFTFNIVYVVCFSSQTCGFWSDINPYEERKLKNEQTAIQEPTHPVLHHFS